MLIINDKQINQVLETAPAQGTVAEISREH